MFEKIKIEKIELVKRVIRQNNYEQYEKTYKQCIELGLSINRQALSRFASKLELIDKAHLSKRQFELHKLEQAQRNNKQIIRQAANNKTNSAILESGNEVASSTQSSYLSSSHNEKTIEPPSYKKLAQDQAATRPVAMKPGEMSYEQVKQRETEITFALGELKIKENELLQELINLSDMLDKRQKN